MNIIPFVDTIIQQRYNNDIKANCQDAANKHLENVVRNNIKQKEKTLVFCAYTSTVDDVQKYLTKQFPNTQKYYATYKAKDEAFQKFTNDNSNILIATKRFSTLSYAL